MKTYTTNREVLEMLEELTDAAQAVIDSWSEGDLAGAVRGLDSHVESSRNIIATAERNHSRDLIEALRFCDMTLADLEASKRKGYIIEAQKRARAALAGIGL